MDKIKTKFFLYPLPVRNIWKTKDKLLNILIITFYK